MGSATEEDAPAGAGAGLNIQSAEDLRDLFTLRSETRSDVRPDPSKTTLESCHAILIKSRSTWNALRPRIMIHLYGHSDLVPTMACAADL